MLALSPFSFLYQKTLHYAAKSAAPYYLACLAFIESIFFPVPPDLMLISMGLASPKKAYRFALICSLFSVLGGIVGYSFGFFAIHWLQPYLEQSSYAASYHQIADWFRHYGVWIVLIAGFTPIPYKLFTFSAGAMQLAFIPFLLGSVLGRSLRFFLVATLLYYYGKSLDTRLRSLIDWLGWGSLGLLGLGYGIYQWMLP